MSTLFESVNKHNRHAFRNCKEFIFDITGYSINFRKLAFDGTLLDETDNVDRIHRYISNVLPQEGSENPTILYWLHEDVYCSS